jgi:AraC-like DNA-binding protein
MRQALQSGDSAGRPRVVLMMMDALLTFMKAEPAAESPRATEVGTSLVLEAAQRVMQSHRMITTSDMAADLGLSVDQFGRRFAREMGSTFAKFGLRSRLHGVAYDLSHGDLPIKAIAADWGFADESHLHRVFLRHFACTPGAYRRQHCGGRGAPALNSS